VQYRVEYAPTGQRSVTTTYVCEQPLQVGQWIEADGVYLVVERLVRGKPGDPYAGVVLCRLAVG
jgi:hypothetical protein